MKQNIQFSTAPDFGTGTYTMLPISYEYINIEKRHFDFYTTHNKLKANCEFHILFFTSIINDKYKFICIDKHGGGLYYISYEEGDGETAGQTKEYRKLTDEEFKNILVKYEPNLPGLSETFKELTLENTKDYLNVIYMHPAKTREYLIKQEYQDRFEFFYSSYSSMTTSHSSTYGSCTKEKYDLWKSQKSGALDDIAYFSLLMRVLEDVHTKRHGLIIGRKITRAVNDLSGYIDSAQYEHGIMSIYKWENNMYTKIMENVSSEQIKFALEFAKKLF